MPVLCFYCDKKPEGYKNSSSLRGHVQFIHPEKLDDFKEKRSALQYVLPASHLDTSKSSNTMHDDDMSSGVVDMSDWDEDDAEEWAEKDAEIALKRQQAKLARLDAKIARYRAEAANPLAFAQASQPLGSPSTLEIVKLVKEMSNTGQQLNISNLKDVVEFAQSLAPQEAPAENDQMMNMLLPLLLRGGGNPLSLAAGQEPSDSPHVIDPWRPIPGETNIEYDARMKGGVPREKTKPVPLSTEEILEDAPPRTKK